MSDSDDDELYCSLDPTTPLAYMKGRSAKPNSFAGPSSKPTTKAKGKRDRSPSHDVEEVHQLSSEHDDDEVTLVTTGNTKVRKATIRSGGVGPNGKTKGKGKEKYDRPKKVTQAHSQTAEAVEVDNVEFIELEGSDGNATAQRNAPVPNVTKKGRGAVVSTTLTLKNNISPRELERMRQKLDMYDEVVKQRDALSHQLEELFRIRETDSERELQQQRLQYEASIKTQETLIKELTSQVARVEPLIRSGKTSVLHLLTREAADEEKRVLDKDLTRWKEIAKEKDLIISGHEKRIVELENLGKIQQQELQMEIQRSKSLVSKTSRNLPSSSRGHTQGGILGADNPKNAEVIKLYEDLTNLLVHSLKFQPGRYLDMDEACFSCIYTYVDLETRGETDDEKKRNSLNFTLRFCHELADANDPNPVTSQSQLHEIVRYAPLELDKETQEFAEKLGFLGDSFTFERFQLPIFIETMQKHLRDASRNGGSEDEEELSTGMQVEDN